MSRRYKTILIRFLFKKIGMKDVSHDKKKYNDQLLDVLDLDLIVDINHGVNVRYT